MGEETMIDTAVAAGALAARHPDITVTRLVVSPLAANCYLLTCRATGELVVVDAGDEATRIIDALDTATAGQRQLVRTIVNTHGHIDHTAAVAELRDVLGPVPVVMHEADIEVVAGNGPDGQRLLGREYRPVLPDRLVREGDAVRWGACALRVIETPGHSPGGICLHGHGLLLSGDTLFRRGVGAWRFFKGDKAALFAGIHQKLLPLPDETVVYPGHGEATTIGEERSENRYLQRSES